jgi:MFS family permease
MRAHGLDPSTFGKVVAVNGILIVALQPLAMSWLDRFPRSRVLAASGILTGLGFGLNAVWHTAPLYAVAVAIWTLGEIANSPVASAIVADLAPPDKRGRYQGAYSMAWGLSTFVGPSVGSLVLGTAGSTTLWTLSFGVGIVIAMGQLALGGRLRAKIPACEPSVS